MKVARPNEYLPSVATYSESNLHDAIVFDMMFLFRRDGYDYDFFFRFIGSCMPLSRSILDIPCWLCLLSQLCNDALHICAYIRCDV